jgi:SepF-like predicted cell division protein (DUF552 family)
MTALSSVFVLLENEKKLLAKIELLENENEELKRIIEELRAEVSRLSQIARY